MIHNIPQPSFEQFVARELENEPKVEIRKGVAFVSCRQVRFQCLTHIPKHSCLKKPPGQLESHIGSRGTSDEEKVACQI